MHKTKKRVGEIILITPLMAGFLWFSGLIINTKNSTVGAALSPSRSSVLITGLFIFIIIYSMFLMVVFWDIHKKHMQELNIKEKPKKKKTNTKKK